MSLGKAIKFFRTQLGLNQSELAAKAGLTTSYVSLLERNKRDPVLSSIEALADALNVPLILLIFTASTEQENEKLGVELCEKLALLAMTTISQE